MADISKLVEQLMVMREVYRHDVKELRKKYEEEKNKVRQDINRTSKRYDVEMERAENEYKNSIDSLKTECRGLYEPLMEELEVRARSYAGRVNRAMLEEVKLFESIPLTADEFGALLNNYGNKNYYVDRVLESLAETNGITTNGLTTLLEPLSLEPDLNTKLSILRDLRGQAEHILENFGTVNEDTLARTGALFPTVLQRAEKLYTNGLYEDTLNSKQIALRVVDSIRANPGNGHRIIDNALANASKATRNALLNILSDEETKGLSYAINKSKARLEIQAFSNNEKNVYKAAEHAVSRIYENISDSDGINAIISANRDNPYFVDMVKNDGELTNTYRIKIE